MLKKIIEWIRSLFVRDEQTETETVDTVEKHEASAEEPQQTETQDIQQMNDYSKIMVHIDNGHASTTPGKRSPYSACKVPPALDFYEYRSNREIARILSDKLAKYGFQVNMVCPEVDDDIKLTVRAGRANAVKNTHPELKHVFVSVHSNACGKGSEWNSAKGWSAWTTKGQNNSDKLAECLYDAAREILPKYGLTTRGDNSDGDSDYEENFTVIYSAAMPAVLTENLFFTNIKETEFLLSDEGKDVIAEIHLRGIMSFADKYLLK